MWDARTHCQRSRIDQPQGREGGTSCVSTEVIAPEPSADRDDLVFPTPGRAQDAASIRSTHGLLDASAATPHSGDGGAFCHPRLPSFSSEAPARAKRLALSHTFWPVSGVRTGVRTNPGPATSPATRQRCLAHFLLTPCGDTVDSRQLAPHLRPLLPTADRRCGIASSPVLAGARRPAPRPGARKFAESRPSMASDQGSRNP
jgi:hypothetical protein